MSVIGRHSVHVSVRSSELLPMVRCDGDGDGGSGGAGVPENRLRQTLAWLPSLDDLSSRACFYAVCFRTPSRLLAHAIAAPTTSYISPPCPQNVAPLGSRRSAYWISRRPSELSTHVRGAHRRIAAPRWDTSMKPHRTG